MKIKISILALPTDFVCSEVLIASELPQIAMKTIKIKMVKSETYGGAFHEKIDKNKKSKCKAKSFGRKNAKVWSQNKKEVPKKGIFKTI